MKKVIFGALALSMIFSCEKDEINVIDQQTQDNLTSGGGDSNEPSGSGNKSAGSSANEGQIFEENGVLNFRTIGYYQAIADHGDYSKIQGVIDLVNSSDFISYDKSQPALNLYDDEFMGAILNPDGVVNIGGWFMKINPIKEKVFIVSDEVENAYDIVTREDEKESNLHVVSTTDNVLDYLQNPNDFTPPSIGCGEDGVAERHDEDWYGTGPFNNTNRAILEHKKYGIYFKIQTKCTSPLVLNQQYWITYSIRQHKKKCQTLYNLGSATAWSPVTGASWNHVLTSGTTNYSKYWIHITAAGRGTVNPYTGIFLYEANISQQLEIRVNL